MFDGRAVLPRRARTGARPSASRTARGVGRYLPKMKARRGRALAELTDDELRSVIEDARRRETRPLQTPRGKAFYNKVRERCNIELDRRFASRNARPS
jgi:hypothetical protein